MLYVIIGYRISRKKTVVYNRVLISTFDSLVRKKSTLDVTLYVNLLEGLLDGLSFLRDIIHG